MLQKINLGKNGELSIPKQIIKSMNLFVGQSFIVQYERGCIFIEPVMSQVQK